MRRVRGPLAKDGLQRVTLSWSRARSGADPRLAREVRDVQLPGDDVALHCSVRAAAHHQAERSGCLGNAVRGSYRSTELFLAPSMPRRTNLPHSRQFTLSDALTN